MREGWMCPRCKLILAPHINVCDCRDKGDAGTPATPLAPVPFGPESQGRIWMEGGQITTTGAGWTVVNSPPNVTSTLYVDPDVA